MEPSNPSFPFGRTRSQTRAAATAPANEETREPSAADESFPGIDPSLAERTRRTLRDTRNGGTSRLFGNNTTQGTTQTANGSPVVASTEGAAPHDPPQDSDPDSDLDLNDLIPPRNNAQSTGAPGGDPGREIVINLSKFLELFHGHKDYRDDPDVTTRIRETDFARKVRDNPLKWLEAIQGLLNDHASAEDDYFEQRRLCSKLRDELEERNVTIEEQQLARDSQQGNPNELRDLRSRLEHTEDRVAALKEKINEYKDTIKSWEKHTANLNEKLAMTEAQLAAAREDLRDHQDNHRGRAHRRSSLSPPRQPPRPVGTVPSEFDSQPRESDRAARGTLASTPWSASTAYTGKGAKPKQPEEFTGEDRLKYPQWKAKMAAFLRFQQQAYPEPRDQAECIATYVAGQAFDLIKPYGLLNNTCQYQSAEDIFRALDDSYLDADPYARASMEMDKLEMKNSDTFEAFYAKFSSLAVHLPGYNIDQIMISMLRKKLTTSLRSKMTGQGIRHDNYQQYVKYVRQVALDQETLDAERPRNSATVSTGSGRTKAGATNSRGSNNTPRTSAPAAKSTNSDGSKRTKLTAEMRKDYATEGRCFKCRLVTNPPHISTDPSCPEYEPRKVVRNNATQVTCDAHTHGADSEPVNEPAKND